MHEKSDPILCMKCQILFLGKNKKNIQNIICWNFTQHAMLIYQLKHETIYLWANKASNNSVQLAQYMQSDQSLLYYFIQWSCMQTKQVGSNYVNMQADHGIWWFGVLCCTQHYLIHAQMMEGDNARVCAVKWQTVCFVCVEVLQPSQPNGAMSSMTSLPNHTVYWTDLVL